jgi:hypothetical protein
MRKFKHIPTQQLFVAGSLGVFVYPVSKEIGVYETIGKVSMELIKNSKDWEEVIEYPIGTKVRDTDRPIDQPYIKFENGMWGVIPDSTHFTIDESQIGKGKRFEVISETCKHCKAECCGGSLAGPCENSSWEKSKPSYTILSFKNEAGRIIEYHSNLRLQYLYVSDVHWIQDIIKEKHWDIHSVRRESDGEVFTIGDTIFIKSFGELVIDSFFITDNNQMLFKNGIVNYKLIDICKKVKPKEWEIIQFIDEQGYTRNNSGVGRNYFDPKFDKIYSLLWRPTGEMFIVGANTTQGIISKMEIYANNDIRVHAKKEGAKYSNVWILGKDIKLVPKKEWEITTFRVAGQIYPVVHNRIALPFGVYTLEECLSGRTAIAKTPLYGGGKPLEIYSVKRLSDGKEFKLGDDITSKDWKHDHIDKKSDIITEIYIASKQTEKCFALLPEGCIVLQTKITWQTNLETAIKIQPKEWEITAFRRKDLKTYYNLQPSGNYFAEGTLMEKEVAGKDFLNGANSFYEIYSVRRLSDGVEFKIGDKFKINGDDHGGLHDPKNIYTIQSFTEDAIKFEFNVHNSTIKDWIKVEKLFTTEDGVDIYDEDTEFDSREKPSSYFWS